MNNFGVQMFGTSEEINKMGLDIVLQSIKDIGYDSVEMCCIFGTDFPEVAKKLDEMAEMFKMPLPSSVWGIPETETNIKKAREMGLEVVSIHAFALGGIPGIVEKCIPEIIEFTKRNSIKHIVLSYMLKDKEGCDSVKDDVNILVENLEKAGVTLSYHNHEMELTKIDNDKTVLDYLLEICDNRLKLQFDTGWGTYADDDIIEFINKYQDRIVSLHLKDIDVDYKNIDRREIFTAIGAGCVKNKEAVELAEKLGIVKYGTYIDQDNSRTGDMIEDLKYGYTFIMD